MRGKSGIFSELSFKTFSYLDHPVSIIKYSYSVPNLRHPFNPVLLLALSALLLHALTPRRLASQLLDLAVSVTLRVALLARGFHRIDAGGFVGFRGGVPGFRAGDGADCGL